MEADQFKYPWDDLDVGQDDFEGLQNFFQKRHDSHEKGILTKVKEEINSDNEDKENAINAHNQNSNKLVNENEIQSVIQKFDDSDSIQKPVLEKSTPANLMKGPWDFDVKPITVIRKDKSPVKIVAPAVYEYKETYQKRKEERIKKILIEEKKSREFRSRPVPNFNTIHENNSKKDSSNPTKMTVPVTPMVLKKSIQIRDHREKMEEYRKTNLAKQFVRHDPIVLHQEPFKPKIHHHEIEPKPFNLNIERRLEERKTYDEQIRKSREEKNKLDEKKRKKQDKELYKEFRKQTVFKAQPNPFK